MKLPPSEKYHLRAQMRLSADAILYSKDDKQLELTARSDLVRQFAHAIFEFGQVSSWYDTETNSQVISLDMYVFAPKDFHAIVREEARRLLNAPTRYPPSY